MSSFQRFGRRPYHALAGAVRSKWAPSMQISTLLRGAGTSSTHAAFGVVEGIFRCRWFLVSGTWGPFQGYSGSPAWADMETVR